MQEFTEKLMLIGFWCSIALILVAIIKIVVNIHVWYKISQSDVYKFEFYQKQADEAIAKGLVKSFGLIIIGIILTWLFW